jgi:hypothetical protein
MSRSNVDFSSAAAAAAAAAAVEVFQTCPDQTAPGCESGTARRMLAGVATWQLSFATHQHSQGSAAGGCCLTFRMLVYYEFVLLQLHEMNEKLTQRLHHCNTSLISQHVAVKQCYTCHG